LVVLSSAALPRLDARSGYSFGLDLMRAIAVMMVMFSHWANNIGAWFHIAVPQEFFFAGDIGVQAFFALSGFLIGRILIDLANTAPTPQNFAVFMARRAMRTLPLYFVWLALVLVFYPPHKAPLFVALQFFTLTQNLATPMPADYFFSVSWSLTVEEWFYLLFTGALISASWMLASGPRALSLCLAVFLLVPLLLRVDAFGWNAQTWDMAKEVVFRIDEIAYGVVMAQLFMARSRVFRHPIPPLVCGLSLIGLCWAGYWPLPIVMIPALGFNVVILGCALCLPAALRLQHAPRWIAAPVHWVSSRSYALYIVHLTILQDFVQVDLLEHVGAVVAAVIAVCLPFVVAECSFRWLERPILRRRPRQMPGKQAVLL
jgi:peptidoglycan/LPS O-acetylase OafA/YrhL